jgi:hypothetical protein
MHRASIHPQLDLIEMERAGVSAAAFSWEKGMR